MHSLSYFLVAAFAIFKISGASSSSYDPNVFSLDDSSIFAVGSENDQEADLFPEDTLEAEVAGLSFLEPDLGAIALNANTALSSTDSDPSRLASEDEISCKGDNSQASKRNLHRTRDLCTQESPQKKPITPEIPNILDIGVKNRIFDGFMVPWDDSPCYPPYIHHLCCTGPSIQLDWLSRLHANVMGCSPWSSICPPGSWEFCCESGSIVDDFPAGPFCLLISRGGPGQPGEP